jgi:nitrogen-specific signal transduction histidine kinase
MINAEMTRGGKEPRPARRSRAAAGERDGAVASRHQRLELLGQLVGGIAHDFNNLITAINGYSELLLARLDGDDPRRNTVLEIRKAGERAGGLTRHLLALGRSNLPHSEPFDLNVLVRDAAPLLRRLLPEDVAIVTDLAGDLGRVEADPDQMHQVLLNLAVNARDAMPSGGKLRIATANALLDDAYRDRRSVVTPGAYVRLEVTDDGQGIAPEVQGHLFEPFFTTKAPGNGTGIGLATVYSIVKQHRGYVWVYSELGLGTTFKVYLPRLGGTRAEAPERPPAPPPGGGETVLLVEDDDMVRTVGAEILRELGYRVLVAADGEGALAVCRSWQGGIALVITDVVMPGLPVVDFIRRLGRTRGEARLLYVSGYPREVVAQRGVLDGGAAFLEKPYDAERLARKVGEVLEAK